MINGKNASMKDIFDSYEYSVEIIVDDSSTADELYASELFCVEHFGTLDEYDFKCRWQVCAAHDLVHDPYGRLSREVPKLIYLFHNADDAMAFKLRWQ